MDALGSCEGKGPSVAQERAGRMLSLCACSSASLGFIKPWEHLVFETPFSISRWMWMRSLGLCGSVSVTAPGAPYWGWFAGVCSRELGSRGCHGKRGILQPWEISGLPVLPIPWEQQVWDLLPGPCRESLRELLSLLASPGGGDILAPRVSEAGGLRWASRSLQPYATLPSPTVSPRCPFTVPQHGSDLFQA